MYSIRMKIIQMESRRTKSRRMKKSIQIKNIRMKKRVQRKSMRMKKIYEWKV